MTDKTIAGAHGAAANLVYWLEQATRDAVVLQYIGVRSGGANVRHQSVVDDMEQALEAVKQLSEAIKAVEKERA